MPNPGYRDDEHRRRKEAVDQALREGFKPKGIVAKRDGQDRSALEVAAERLGINRNTLHTWANISEGTQWQPNWRLYFRTDPESPPSQDDDTPESRRDLRDTSFWRKKAVDLQKQLADAEHVAEQLAGIRGQSITIPEWLAESKDSKKGKVVVGLLLSDVHAGEKVDSGELNGLNEYNIEVCRKRLRRLFSASCELPKGWIGERKCEGFLLALGGDLISGSIHHELEITNELTAHEQVKFVVEEIAAGIAHLVDTFGRVHVASVPGNHGRTTVKPTAKLYSKLSYDTLAADMIAAQFKNDPRVTFQIGHSTDQLIPVFGRMILLTHGDKTGSGGGQGFAGPDLPIVRGGKKVAMQQASVGRRIDLVLRGHLHFSTHPGNILSNGSVVGLSEYSQDLRAEVQPPRQWLFLLHSKWGLRERVDIQLEEPIVLDKPRVRIPSWSAPQ